MEQGFPHCDLFDSVFVCVIVKKGFPILISSTAFAGPAKPGGNGSAIYHEIL